jgi:hypothetical protein
LELGEPTERKSWENVPALDGLWMKASEDGSGSSAIEKRFNDLKLPCGCAKESLAYSHFDLCVLLSHCATYFRGFLPRLFLRPCSASRRVSSAAIAFMRDDAEPGRQSLLPALFFSLFGLEVNIIRIFELLVPFTAKLAEVCPIVLFAVAQVLDHFKVRLGTQVP